MAWSLCQRSVKYNLKAIHNYAYQFRDSGKAVSKIGKIQFESNSQQTPGNYIVFKAVSKIGKIQFESNSQRRHIRTIVKKGCVKDR